MSINLHASVNGSEISLWQTPTQITDMCVVQPDGTLLGDMRGKKAIHALQIYLQWVKGSTTGQWEAKELARYKKCVNEHIIKIRMALKYAKTVRVWIL